MRLTLLDSIKKKWLCAAAGSLLCIFFYYYFFLFVFFFLFIVLPVCGCKLIYSITYSPCCHFWSFMTVPNLMLRTAVFSLLSLQFLFVVFFVCFLPVCRCKLIYSIPHSACCYFWPLMSVGSSSIVVWKGKGIVLGGHWKKKKLELGKILFESLF